MKKMMKLLNPTLSQQINYFQQLKDPDISGDFDNGLQKWKNSYLWKDVDPKNIIIFFKKL
jgi:hypothetical protein